MLPAARCAPGATAERGRTAWDKGLGAKKRVVRGISGSIAEEGGPVTTGTVPLGSGRRRADSRRAPERDWGHPVLVESCVSLKAGTAR